MLFSCSAKFQFIQSRSIQDIFSTHTHNFYWAKKTIQSPSFDYKENEITLTSHNWLMCFLSGRKTSMFTCTLKSFQPSSLLPDQKSKFKSSTYFSLFDLEPDSHFTWDRCMADFNFIALLISQTLIVYFACCITASFSGIHYMFGMTFCYEAMEKWCLKSGAWWPYWWGHRHDLKTGVCHITLSVCLMNIYSVT